MHNYLTGVDLKSKEMNVTSFIKAYKYHKNQ